MSIEKEPSNPKLKSTLGDEEAIVLLSLDEVCDEFEAGYKRGELPKVETFLKGVAESRRIETLHELLRVDVYYRKKRNELPSSAEYQSRFPELSSSWLQQLLHMPPHSHIKHDLTLGTKEPSVEIQVGMPIVPGYQVLEWAATIAFGRPPS